MTHNLRYEEPTVGAFLAVQLRYYSLHIEILIIVMKPAVVSLVLVAGTNCTVAK